MTWAWSERVNSYKNDPTGKDKNICDVVWHPVYGPQKFVPASPRLTRLVYTGFVRQKNLFLHKYANQLGCQMPNWMRTTPLNKSNACIIDSGLLSVSGSANLTAPPRHVYPVTSILTSNELFGTTGISTRSIWTNTKCKNNFTWIITSFATHINVIADRSGVRWSLLSTWYYEMYISWREMSIKKRVT